MKVHLLTAATEWGGLEVHAAALASTLEARGYDVAIVELGRNGFGRWKAARNIQTKVIYVPLDKSGRLDKPLQDVGWMTWFRILRRLQGDICVFTKGGFDVGSCGLDIAARLSFRRYITIEQLACPMPHKTSRRFVGGALPGIGLWWYWTRLRRRLRSPWPHAVVCVSDAVRTPLARDYRFAARKLVTVQNGIEIAKFHPDPRRRQEVRNKWGVPKDALVLGAVGRLAPVKGYEVAIESFARLMYSPTRRDIRLVLVGDGPSRGDLERLAREKGLTDRILFPGFTDRPQDIYPALDVFLMPSLNEGLPLALIEAMACQCCPIAMGVGGVPEVIVDASLGWLVEPGEQEHFFEAMKAVVQMNGDELAKMGRHAHEYVVRRFDAQVQLAAIADLIERTETDRPRLFGRRRLSNAAASNT
jgi:glycosyltransferase involved in cell wall biosynthesis